MLTPRVMPHRLLNTRDVVVIRHPRPVASDHLLLLPCNRTPGLDGDRNRTALALDSMLNLVSPLVRAHLERPENVIAVVNGGARQDVRLLHMHLLSDGELAASLEDAEENRFSTQGHLATSRPLQRVHLLYDRTALEMIALIAEVQRALKHEALESGRYSLMARAIDPTLLHLAGSINDLCPDVRVPAK